MDSIKHNVILEDRNKLAVDGVNDVVSFDDVSVILDTVSGRLNIVGTNLHIQLLCLDSGKVVIDGEISEMVYEDERASVKKGFFGRFTG